MTLPSEVALNLRMCPSGFGQYRSQQSAWQWLVKLTHLRRSSVPSELSRGTSPLTGYPPLRSLYRAMSLISSVMSVVSSSTVVMVTSRVMSGCSVVREILGECSDGVQGCADHVQSIREGLHLRVNGGQTFVGTLVFRFRGHDVLGQDTCLPCQGAGVHPHPPVYSDGQGNGDYEHHR